MTESGMGYDVNAGHLTFFPVAGLKNLLVHCKFPMGPSTITGVEEVSIVIVVIGSS
jgi:hypothetical protein